MSDIRVISWAAAVALFAVCWFVQPLKGGAE